MQLLGDGQIINDSHSSASSFGTMNLQAKTEELVTADALEVSGWGDDDPTVFLLTIAKRMQGEFQVTNGYGPHRATHVMKVTPGQHI